MSPRAQRLPFGELTQSQRGFHFGAAKTVAKPDKRESVICYSKQFRAFDLLIIVNADVYRIPSMVHYTFEQH